MFATWLLLALGATCVAGFSNSDQRTGLAETHLIDSVSAQWQLVVLMAIRSYFSLKSVEDC